MNRSDGAHRERIAALVLACGAALCGWLVLGDAEALESRLGRRREQLGLLAALRASAPSAEPARTGATVADLEGLFPGHRVVWIDGVGGPALALRASVPAEPPR